jgi:hypothetical protein
VVTSPMPSVLTLSDTLQSVVAVCVEHFNTLKVRIWASQGFIFARVSTCASLIGARLRWVQTKITFHRPYL